jgi:hypothetical protein
MAAPGSRSEGLSTMELPAAVAMGNIHRGIMAAEQWSGKPGRGGIQHYAATLAMHPSTLYKWNIHRGDHGCRSKAHFS